MVKEILMDRTCHKQCKKTLALFLIGEERREVGGSRSNARETKMFDNKETAFFFWLAHLLTLKGKEKGKLVNK